MAGIVAPQLVPPVPGIPLANAGGAPALSRVPSLPFGADPGTITGWVAQDENGHCEYNDSQSRLTVLYGRPGSGRAFGRNVSTDVGNLKVSKWDRESMVKC
jgi:hypothetical protein